MQFAEQSETPESSSLTSGSEKQHSHKAAMKSSDKYSRAKQVNRLVLWARRVGLANKSAVGLALGAVLSGVATYATFSNVGPFEPTPSTLYVLLLFNLVLLLALGALVARQLVRLWMARRKGAAGSRLHGRIVTLFSMVAIVPTIIVAIFSSLFFEFGLQAWFSDKVQTVLDNSQSVAEAYIDEHRNVIKADILGMAKDINAEAYLLSRNERLLEQAISLQARLLSLSEAMVFDGTGNVLARSTSTFNIDNSEYLPNTALLEAAKGKVVFLTSKDDDRIRALVKLDGYIDQYLYISRYVDARALALVDRTSATKADYEQVLADLSQYRLWFNLTFMFVALLILFAAVWTGLGLSTQLMIPIRQLVSAAERIRKGDLSVNVPIDHKLDELGGLTRAFNRMATKLEQQQGELLETNMKLDERRRFTEAVLSGVSAGVLGLTREGIINLPNKSAMLLLGKGSDELIGQKLHDAVPEMAALFENVINGGGDGVVDQIVLKYGDVTLNFLVRITVELKEKTVEGYVVTFDDITEQVVAERTAAWADIAQRIAHEIKNPLTPIQLSAERLKRKYGDEIASDPATFQQCTDTIIRQVRDLRRMVDEFSSFARMPTPVFQLENLIDVVKRAVFMMEVTYANITFEMSLPDGPLNANCDGRQIGQALTNLLKNAAQSIRAINETGEDGCIHVRLSVIEQNVLIEVRDNGVGIPEDMRDRLTEPYVTTRKKGTGLGLAIVKKIMKDHGGVLEIVNNDGGKGACARLKFLMDVSERRSPVDVE
ncbi:MAG: two-component sensor histidine kinase [Kordiimonas sp.]|nr:two-component sensor histidine kinase [Kordiimonas sp.]